MNLLVIGAAGMIGRKLCQRISRDGRLAGRAIEEAHLADIVTPPPWRRPFRLSARPATSPRLMSRQNWPRAGQM